MGDCSLETPNTALYLAQNGTAHRHHSAHIPPFSATVTLPCGNRGESCSSTVVLPAPGTAWKVALRSLPLSHSLKVSKGELGRVDWLEVIPGSRA